MADNKNMEINDEEMQNAAGGNWNVIGLPCPRFKEGDHVRVKGYEEYDAVIVKVLSCSQGFSGKTWNYEVHIFQRLMKHPHRMNRDHDKGYQYLSRH